MASSLKPISRRFFLKSGGIAMVGVGVYFASRNKNTDDYFRGGQNIPWWAAACSIYATMLSSLTYVALPALVFATDWLLYPGMFMILAAAPVAVGIAMPFFRRIDATSAYEYFGRRFGLPVRLISSGLFTLFHISRMGIVMALTALALAAVTGLAPSTCVLIMGGLCLGQYAHPTVTDLSVLCGLREPLQHRTHVWHFVLRQVFEILKGRCSGGE